MWQMIKSLICKNICIGCLRTVLRTRIHYDIRTQFRRFNNLSLPALSVALVNTINIEQEKESSDEDFGSPTLTNPVIEACIDSLHSMSEFLDRILEAMAYSFLQYKQRLSEFYACLKNYEKFQSSRIVSDEIEDAIIQNRSKVRDAEMKYLEFISLAENIKKVAKAMFELSFLIQEENLVLQVSEKLDYVNESIEVNNNEIKDIKRKIYELENLLITNTFIEIEHENKDNGDSES